MAMIHSGQTKRQVPKKKFDSNWDRTFGKKKEKAVYKCDICKDTEILGERESCSCCWEKDEEEIDEQT
jgi:hypothetical protein